MSYDKTFNWSLEMIVIETKTITKSSPVAIDAGQALRISANVYRMEIAVPFTAKTLTSAGYELDITGFFRAIQLKNY